MKEAAMALFRAYFDDSGTHRGSDVVVMGGLVGTDSQWEGFDAAWRAKLLAPLPDKPRLRKFHLSTCMAADREFENYKPVERQAVAGAFRDIIIDAKLASTASAVDRKAWDELVTGSIRELLGDALNVCFLHCINRAVEYARSWGAAGDQIAIVFDEGTKTDRLCRLIDIYRRQKLIEMNRGLPGPEVVSITFGMVEKFTPLQGADIIATESYWHALKSLDKNSADLRPPFLHYLKNAQAEGLLFDRAAIITELQGRDAKGFLKSRDERPSVSGLLTALQTFRSQS
jgi:Protein of unknown function (DUF3800)